MRCRVVSPSGLVGHCRNMGGVQRRRSPSRSTMTVKRSGFGRGEGLTIHRVPVSADAPDAALRRSYGMVL
jgi:hypothetical protein